MSEAPPHPDFSCTRKSRHGSRAWSSKWYWSSFYRSLMLNILAVSKSTPVVLINICTILTLTPCKPLCQFPFFPLASFRRAIGKVEISYPILQSIFPRPNVVSPVGPIKPSSGTFFPIDKLPVILSPIRPGHFALTIHLVTCKLAYKEL